MSSTCMRIPGRMILLLGGTLLWGGVCWNDQQGWAATGESAVIERFTGVFMPGSSPQQLAHGNEGEFRAKLQEMSAKGWQPENVEATCLPAGTHFYGVFRKRPEMNEVLLALPWEEFRHHWSELERKGYALRDVATCQEDDNRTSARQPRKWSGVFKKGKVHANFFFMDLDGFKKTYESFNKKGLNLTDMVVFSDGDKLKYGGIMAPTGERVVFNHGMTWSSLKVYRKAINKHGFRIFHVEEYVENKGQASEDIRFATLAIQDKKREIVSHNLTLPQLLAEYERRFEQNMILTSLHVRSRKLPLRTDPPNKIPAEKVTLRGNTECPYGSTNCNPCARQVQKQFNDAFRGGTWKKRTWTFKSSKRYSPDGRKAGDAFNPNAPPPPRDGGVISKHIQGLAMTMDPKFPFVGSHSNKDDGSIFFVRQNDDEKHSVSLWALYNSTVHHPSGVAVLGDMVFVAEQSRLRWFPVFAVRLAETRTHNEGFILKDREEQNPDGLRGAGGGLALAQLEDETTLLVYNAPGGGFRGGVWKENKEDRYTYLYRFLEKPTDPDPEKIQFLGKYHHGKLSKTKPSKPIAYSENLSLVTECETGALYTIHTTGDYNLGGKGWWVLSLLKRDSDNKPILDYIAAKSQDQREKECHHRSAATVSVDEAGNLIFLCSERHEDPRRNGRFSLKYWKP